MVCDVIESVYVYDVKRNLAISISNKVVPLDTEPAFLGARL